MSYLAKIRTNRNNQQLLVHLSKKKLKILKEKKARFLKVEEEDLVF